MKFVTKMTIYLATNFRVSSAYVFKKGQELDT